MLPSTLLGGARTFLPGRLNPERSPDLLALVYSIVNQNKGQIRVQGVLHRRSSLAFTTDVHSHIIEGIQAEAMMLLDEVLPPDINGVLCSGGVTERLMVAVLKTAFAFWRTWVRIPPPPLVEKCLATMREVGHA